MSVFERNGKWVAKFVRHGKQHWVPGGPWAEREHAEQAEAEYRRLLDSGRTEETCRSFAERWLREWPRRSPATQRLYASAAKRFAEHFGETPLGDVNRLAARTWALSVPRSISRVIGTMYGDALNVGLVRENPFANLRLPATEREAEIKPPTMEEYRALLDACTVLGGYGPEFRAMIQFAAWTGIRQGELFALTWEDVGDGEVRIRQSRKLDGTLGPPKNGQGRTIPILPPADVLDQVPRRKGSPFVFHTPRGKPLTKGTHAWSWNKVRAAAGVDCRWHDLRHFCATQLLELGVDHFAVSIQLGHTDGGALVMSRYGHPSVDAAKRRLVAAFGMAEHDVVAPPGSRRAQSQ